MQFDPKWLYPDRPPIEGLTAENKQSWPRFVGFYGGSYSLIMGSIVIGGSLLFLLLNASNLSLIGQLAVLLSVIIVVGFAKLARRRIGFVSFKLGIIGLPYICIVSLFQP